MSFAAPPVEDEPPDLASEPDPVEDEPDEDEPLGADEEPLGAEEDEPLGDDDEPLGEAAGLPEDDESAFACTPSFEAVSVSSRPVDFRPSFCW